MNEVLELFALNQIDEDREIVGHEDYDPYHKFDLCINCKNNYPQELELSIGTCAILCQHCKGLRSNYEALSIDNMKKVGKDGK